MPSTVTQSAPGTWFGLTCNSLSGCALSVFARKNACLVWAWRKDDNALRVYSRDQLRRDGGYTNEFDGKIHRLPMLRLSQAARVFRAICPAGSVLAKY